MKLSCGKRAEKNIRDLLQRLTDMKVQLLDGIPNATGDDARSEDTQPLWDGAPLQAVETPFILGRRVKCKQRKQP